MFYSRVLKSLIFSLAFSAFVQAQSPDVSWYKSYGGQYLDQGESVVQTPDGGYLIAGFAYVSLTGGTDIYLIKTDQWGIPIWERYYGGASDDWANCICQTRDGGYLIAGGTESYDVEGSDVLLMKVDQAADPIWIRTYGGLDDESAEYACQTSDDGFIISGWTNSFGAGGDDIYLIKTDYAGELLWSRTFGDQFYDKGYKVVESSDGGYVLVGGINYFGYYPVDSYLVKTDADGDTIWSSIIGGSQADACNALTRTPDDGYIIAGWTMSFGAGQHDYYVVKVDSSGVQEWYKTYGGADTDVARSICSLSDGGYLTTGYTESFGNGEYDVYLVKTNYKGDSLWTGYWGGESQDYASEVIETNDGGLAIVGWTRSYSVGSKDVLLLKYGGYQTSVVDGSALPGSFSLSQNYPNPFNESTVIEFSIPDPGSVSLKVYDTLGREVASIIDNNIAKLENKALFDASGLSSGVYIYSLQAGKYVESKKMILLK